MTDVLTWTIGRRLEPAKRAGLLGKELGELELEVARLEAAEVVFGQWAEATDGGGGRQASCRVLVESRPAPMGVVHVSEGDSNTTPTGWGGGLCFVLV